MCTFQPGNFAGCGSEGLNEQPSYLGVEYSRLHLLADVLQTWTVDHLLLWPTPWWWPMAPPTWLALHTPVRTATWLTPGTSAVPVSLMETGQRPPSIVWVGTYTMNIDCVGRYLYNEHRFCGYVLIQWTSTVWVCTYTMNNDCVGMYLYNEQRLCR